MPAGAPLRALGSPSVGRRFGGGGVGCIYKEIEIGGRRRGRAVVVVVVVVLVVVVVGRGKPLPEGEEGGWKRKLPAPPTP